MNKYPLQNALGPNNQNNNASQNTLGHNLGLPLGQTHLPRDRFNLFHIDNKELHLETLNVSAFLLDTNQQSLQSRETDVKLESALLLQNGCLHVNSRSLVFDQDQSITDKRYPDLIKFRYNSKFEYEVLSGEQLEVVHQHILETQQQKLTSG